jgi:hypothetical protein
MNKYGIKINFAHQTFKWSNEARGKAAVYCVFVGFSLSDRKIKKLYHYSSVSGPAAETTANNINAYLIDGPQVFITSRTKPLCAVPEIGIGNKPIDGGNYLFTEKERDEFIKIEPNAANFFRPWIGSDEFINRYFRYCLWLGDVSPSELRKMPKAMERVEAVKQFRLASTSEGTRKIADKPRRFHVENMPGSDYIVIPKVSSENRKYIPIGILSPETLASDLVFIIPDATLYHLGVLMSGMHMAWMRYVCGRLEMRYRYSKDIVYNNFPWPSGLQDKQKDEIGKNAQNVLDVRSKYPDSSLADLYDPVAMPPDLVKAHQKMDGLVEKAYGKTFGEDAARVAYLFELYQKMVGELFMEAGKKGRKK